MKRRSIFLKFISTAGVLVALLFSTQNVLAACNKEVKALEDSIFAVDAARSEQQAQCGDLRLCKSDCKSLKRKCKTSTKIEKNACKAECNNLSGNEKKLCKSDCRSGKKSSKASCKNAKKHCKGTCRASHKTAACKTARRATTKAVIASARAAEKLYSCSNK